MKRNLSILVMALILGFLINPGAGQAQFLRENNSPLAEPIGEAFTYQGYLTDSLGPVTGSCDFQFGLWDADSGGTQVGSTLTLTNVSLDNGYFTVQLDWGSAVFQGDARWLEIGVACPTGSGSYTQLIPRQSLTAAPYATFAHAADPTVMQQRITGTCSSGNAIRVVNQDGSVNCEPTGSNAWMLTGNSGTSPGTNYLGTSDNTTLVFKVNNAHALRIEPSSEAPNLIGGWWENYVVPGVRGATVGGGGGGELGENWVTDDFGTVGGGTFNRAGDDVGTTADRSFATVSGGYANTAAGEGSTASGGGFNRANGYGATVGGGVHNAAYGYLSTVGGGGSSFDYAGNRATDNWTTVSGGTNNQAGDGVDNGELGSGATVGGGDSNLASGNLSTIAGGLGNIANGDTSVVVGGYHNQATLNDATVGGGGYNVASGNSATVGGGWENNATNWHSTVSGGLGNDATGDKSAIGGGHDNVASGFLATIGGGYTNMAGGNDSFIGGGWTNTASGESSVVAGGESNVASGGATTVGGGELNIANMDYATVAGGGSNAASGYAATVAGGGGNQAVGSGSVVAGGIGMCVGTNFNNVASGGSSTISGGACNLAETEAATIAGGIYNTANGNYATVSGGGSNTASGFLSTIPGGADNVAAGNYSFAAGRRAQANQSGAFVWADDLDTDFASTNSNTFRVRATNGAEFVANNAGYGLIAANSGAGDGLRAMTNTSVGVNWAAVYATNLGTSPAVYANSAGTYSGYFLDNIYVEGSCIGCTTAFVAINAGSQPLETGDLVSVKGMIDPLQSTNQPLLAVQIASGQGGGAIGVVQSKAALTISEKDGTTLQSVEKTDGEIAVGDHLIIVVQGIALVKVDASVNSINPGDRLTAATTPGHARPLRTVMVEGVALNEGAPVVGIALEELTEGTDLIAVFISLQ